MVSWGPQICEGQRSRPARSVGEEGEEEGGVGLFSMPSGGGLWTCVCESFGRGRVERVEGGAFPEHSWGFRLSRFFCGERRRWRSGLVQSWPWLESATGRRRATPCQHTRPSLYGVHGRVKTLLPCVHDESPTSDRRCDVN